MSDIQILPVRSKAEMKAFIELPWKIYENDPCWVPPIKSGMARLLDTSKHPFWKFSQRELFLAKRDGTVVGRIAALIDGNYNRHNNEKVGAWGFFECDRDNDTAVALFVAAEQWVKAKGMEFFRGPMNPSVNYEIGLLIQGFDRPPVLGFTYNPPYYHELVRAAGLRKEKDLFAFYFTEDFVPPAWALEVADRITQKGEIRIRKAEKKNLVAELKLINDIYNQCWSGNWGYVPMTEGEIFEVCNEMIHFVDPDLITFLYYGDEPVGVSLVLPDINPLLKKFNGRGGLWALALKNIYWSEVTGVRGYILGVKEEYRQMGVPMVAFDYLMKILPSKENYHYMELGWTLEDNDAINRLFEEGNATPSRRFRIYGREI